jgi:hypothetical protein
MGMMRKLMMGCAPGGRTLVNTTTATKNTPITPPMDFKVGASYSVSWAGTIPSSQYFTLFEISGNSSSSSNARKCLAQLMYSRLYINFLGTSLYDKTVSAGDSIALELRFKVNTVSISSPYYTMDVELYVNGTQEVSRTVNVTIKIGDGFSRYSNAAGTFIIKKLS